MIVLVGGADVVQSFVCMYAEFQESLFVDTEPVDVFEVRGDVGAGEV